MKVLALALLLVASATLSLAATAAECNTYATSTLPGKTVSDTDSTTISTKKSTCGSSCTADCTTTLIDRMAHLASADGMFSCQDVRYYIYSSTLTCLKDEDNNDCAGGLQQVISSFASGSDSLMTYYTKMMDGSSFSLTDSQLTTACGNKCTDAGIIAMDYLYTGSTDSAISVRKMFSFIKDTVCTKKDNKFCYNDAKAGLAAVVGEGGVMKSTTSQLDNGICSTTNRCAKVGLNSIADILVELDPSGAQGKAFSAFVNFLCLKDKTDYCLLRFSKFPTSPTEGACTGKTGSDASCNAHLKTFLDMGCCLGSVMDLADVVGTSASATLAIFASANIKIPTACSLNAYQVPFTVTLNGLTQTQAAAVTDGLKKDISLAAGVSKSAVSLTISTTQGKDYKVMGGMNLLATTVSGTISVPSKAEATLIESTTKTVDLPNTQKAAVAKGVSAKVTASAVTAKPPVVNTQATGDTSIAGTSNSAGMVAPVVSIAVLAPLALGFILDY